MPKRVELQPSPVSSVSRSSIEHLRRQGAELLRAIDAQVQVGKFPFRAHIVMDLLIPDQDDVCAQERPPSCCALAPMPTSK